MVWFFIVLTQLGRVSAGEPTRIARCEFLLQGHYARDALSLLRLELGAGWERVPAFFDARPTRTALTRLGLNSATADDLEISIRGSRMVEHLYWVTVHTTSGHAVAKFPLHFPPVFAWKRFDTLPESMDHVDLDSSFASESPYLVEIGSVFDQVGDTRRFFAVSGFGSARVLKLTIGVDVGCSVLAAYTLRPGLEYVASGDDLLCRVRVLTATLTRRP